MFPFAPGPGRNRPPAFDYSRLDLATLRAERDRVLARIDGHKPPITRVLPVARAIPLGGSLRVALEFQLRDLAQLQAWLEDQEPHPLAGMPPAWADPEPATRVARLAAAWERCSTWPPRLGTDRGSELLGSRAGRAYFLCTCLRKCDPAFGVAEALELLPEITPTEWAGLARIAYAIGPREEIAAELAAEPGQSRTGDWCLSFYRLLDAGNLPPGTPFGELYLSQWRAICGQGKAGELTSTFGETSRRVRKALEVNHG
jgi:hypothetical protein